MCGFNIGVGQQETTVVEYEEIEDPKEIRRLNAALSSKLKKSLKHSETRIIGYPQGKFEADVHFRPGSGSDVFYWSAGASDNKKVAHNFFGHGEPGAKASLNIDVQFNLPVVDFSRDTGGAFLRHRPTDSITLAHRGIVTLGHGRIPKATLFGEMAATLREAETSGGIADFLIIGELESSTLIDDIDAFSSELRRAARTLKSNRSRKSAKQGRSNRTARVAAKLREYFDEFSGQRCAGGRRKSVADCYHGKVVRAIRDGFDGTTTLKSVAIDLTVLTSRRAFLFEAKTSADTQSVYAAVGQLAVHGPQVTAIASGLPLVKVIVLPELPSTHLCTVLKTDLGISLLTFTRSARGDIAIDGLKNLQFV